MPIAEQQLAQVRPAGTVAVSAYSPPASTTAVIRSVVIVNTTASIATFQLFADNDGSTFDESTALIWAGPLDGGQTAIVNEFWALNNVLGNFGVRTDTANALTFTLWGAELT